MTTMSHNTRSLVNGIDDAGARPDASTDDLDRTAKKTHD